jgi:hypothetical protein
VRLDDQPPDDDIGAARLVDSSAAKVVKVTLKAGKTLGKRTIAKVRATGDN